ncbi:MAG: UDP-N-acetylmuramate--L-alanine ligase [Chitinophagales bacterium]
MTQSKNIQKIYFIGIGGIGMSSLARYFLAQGKKVSGYDKTETALTKKLVKEGIPVHYTDDPNLAPKDAEWIVYTPAIPKDHRELQFYTGKGYTILKRSEVLGEITKSSFNICVAGTHGKTTVTTMIAHILRDSGYGCNAFLGGIAVNYDSNFWSNERNVCVIEADEYDRSFLRLSPDIAVITAMDPDHLDIYGTEKAVEDAFIEFSGKLKKNGLLIRKWGLTRENELLGSRHLSYAVGNQGADVYADPIQIKNGSYLFDVGSADWSLKNIRLTMGGLHNIENSVAAITAARELGISDEKIKKAVAGFKGVKRRFEYIISPRTKKDGKPASIFIDDYAHHPEELKALISGARNLFPDQWITVLFQPHLFSRTRDFAEGFAKSLDMADEVVLMPVYPARELPIGGVSSELILAKMKIKEKKIFDRKELLDWVRNEYIKQRKEKTGVLITAGAGDIDTLVEPIAAILKKTN